MSRNVNISKALAQSSVPPSQNYSRTERRNVQYQPQVNRPVQQRQIESRPSTVNLGMLFVIGFFSFVVLMVIMAGVFGVVFGEYCSPDLNPGACS